MAVDPDPVAARKRGRAFVMAVLLGAFVILLYAISIAKIGLSTRADSPVEVRR